MKSAVLPWLKCRESGAPGQCSSVAFALPPKQPHFAIGPARTCRLLPVGCLLPLLGWHWLIINWPLGPLPRPKIRGKKCGKQQRWMSRKHRHRQKCVWPHFSRAPLLIIHSTMGQIPCLSSVARQGVKQPNRRMAGRNEWGWAWSRRKRKSGCKEIVHGFPRWQPTFCSLTHSSAVSTNKTIPSSGGICEGIAVSHSAGPKLGNVAI